MIVVIQCAGGKQPGAGFLQTNEGRRVCFVADPSAAPATEYAYARPDDHADIDLTWRNAVLQYNQRPDNRLGLMRAFELYRNPIYRRLAAHIGTGNLYILSAGWGLIAANFLTPVYDITFSNQAENYKRRRKSHIYDDFCMLPMETAAPIVFFGSTEYAPLFASLTASIKVPKIVFYRSDHTPDLPGCTALKFSTRRRTNWQYECAEAFIDGRLALTFDPSHTSAN